MKRLNTDGELTLNILAQVSLHEKLQEMFDIYPGQLVDDVQHLARRESKDPYALLEELRVLIPLEFDIVLAVVSMTLAGKHVDCSPTDRPYSREIRQRFQLDPRKMIRDYPKKARAIGLDVQDIIQGLREIMPRVIQWALDEVYLILKQQRVK